MQICFTFSFHGERLSNCSSVIFSSGLDSNKNSRYLYGLIPLALAVSNNENTIMLASAPSVVSQNSQFFRPTVTGPTCLIPFKAKAWLDLKERKLNGEQVDSKNIKKHKNDVFRLAQLITANTRQVLSSEIAEDMKKFLSEIADETVDLKSLGIRGTDKQKIIDMLYLCYNLNDNT